MGRHIERDVITLCFRTSFTLLTSTTVFLQSLGNYLVLSGSSVEDSAMCRKFVTGG